MYSIVLFFAQHSSFFLFSAIIAVFILFVAEWILS